MPSASRKCPGLKVFGVSHSSLSNRTDVKLVITDVPCIHNYTIRKNPTLTMFKWLVERFVSIHIIEHGKFIVFISLKEKFIQNKQVRQKISFKYSHTLLTVTKEGQI